MRVTKPQTASLIARPFEFRRTRYCAFSVLACVPLGDAPALVSEQSLWNDVGRYLPKGWVLDEGLPKGTPEFLVAGRAWVNGDAKAPACEVSVRLGAASKTLSVTGDRHFIGRTPSEPVPFRSMPLTWETAFGGEGYASNPLGKGAGPTKDSGGRKIHCLPNVEYSARRQSSPSEKVPAACFGPVDIRWPLRADKAGTYDKRWLEDRYPGLADDIDWALFNFASPDQQLTRPLLGNEDYVLVGLHPSRPEIRGRLPGVQARLFVQRDSAEALQEPAMTLKTVWFLPEAERAVLVWNGSVEVEQPDASDLNDVVLGFDWSNDHRPAAHFADVLDKRRDPVRGPLGMLDDQSLVPAGCPQIDVVSLGGAGARLEDCPGYANAQRQLSAELKQSGSELNSAMDAIGVEIAASDPELLELLSDLERIDSAAPEEQFALRERLDEYLQQQRVELEAFAAEGQRELDQAMALLDEQDDQKDQNNQKDRNELNEKPSTTTGPPAFSAARERDEIRQRIEDGDIDDKTRAELREALCNEDMDRMLDFAETSDARAYRMTAHHRKPTRRVDVDRQLRARLAESLRSGDSLAGADFCGADLSGMDLSGQDLSGIYLESANLDQANLTGASFDNAVLAHASLRGARADDASLVAANLGHAVMTEFRAARAGFSSAVLEAAVLHNARLEQCAMDSCSIRGLSLQGAHLVDCDLTGLVFVETLLDEAEFRGSRLGDGLFYQQHLEGVCFEGADLAETTFYECTAAGVSFMQASMTNARLVGASDFSGTNFKRARLSEAMLGDLRLSGARFDGADLSAANLRGAMLENASFIRARCVDAQFVNANIAGADFSGANLMRASLERVDARGARFRSACLFQADLALIHVDTETDFAEAMTEKMRTLPRKFPREAVI